MTGFMKSMVMAILGYSNSAYWKSIHSPHSQTCSDRLLYVSYHCLCGGFLFHAELIQTFPQAMAVDDVMDFCSLAQHFMSKTPVTFKQVCL